MHEEIKLVLKYCTINKFSLNFKKTNYILSREVSEDFTLAVAGLQLYS